MTPGKAIYTRITSDSTINGLIGGRCYDSRIPENATWPAVMYQKISDVPIRDNDGSTVFVARFQVNVYAITRADAQRIGTLIMDQLDNIIQTTINHVNVVECALINELDDVDDFSDYNGLFRTVQDYSLTYHRMIS